MSFKQKTSDYLNAFAQKDLQTVEHCFAEEATLRDWDNEAYGRFEVLKCIDNIFQNTPSLDIDILSLFEDNQTVVAEMIIETDTDQLLVTDIIEFNSEGLITGLRAYLG